MEKNKNEEANKSKWPLVVSASILALAVGSYFVIPGFQDFVKEAYSVLTSDDEARISTWVNQLGWWGPVLIIIVMVLQMFLLVIPSPLLMVVSVLAYGPVWGAILSIVAVACASTVGYWIGRFLGEVAVYKLIGEKKERKIELYVERYGWWAIIITRLAPILSNDAISLVGGMLRMGYLKFIGATLIGITPLSILIGYFGENSERLRSGLIWTTVVCMVLLAAYIIYDHKTNRVKEVEKSM